MSHHLAELADAHLDRVGDHESLLFEGTAHTLGSLHDRATRVAGGLVGLGLQPDDRVVVLTMNTPEVGILYNACWRAGAVVTPVLFLISPPELRHILEDCEPFAVVVTPELMPLLASASEGLDLRVLVIGEESFAALEAADPLPIVPRDDDDLAALLYTGGTTGRSKGVMLTHRGLWFGGYALHVGSSELKTTRAIVPLPLSHAFGLMVACAAMHAEGPRFSVLQRWFDAADWVRQVETHRLESSPVVPSMLTMLLALPLEEHDLSSLKMFGSGGAPLPPALRTQVMDRIGVEIFEGYGLTEATAGVSANRYGSNRPGSVGQALHGVEIEIRSLDGAVLGPDEDGEICVRSWGVMRGYWKSPEQTAATVEGGWLHTGDVGHLDADGYLYVVDRIKDLIIRGGFNVYPRDVEDALLEHPDVVQAAVVGVADEASGEEVCAVVALRPGSALTGPELVEWSRGRLAKYKYPRDIRVVDAVPLTSVGKTNRKAVRDLLA
jgi:long-chain acyl-CoA synthetase